MSKYDDVIKIMNKRGGKDTLISIATMDGNRLFARMVDGYYMEGAYYIVTYALSNKMKQIEANHEVAVSDVEWITAHGIGENLGWVLDESNSEIMKKLRLAFASWYNDGHVNEKDPNTCLLRIRLTDGIVIDHERTYGQWRYEVDFENKSVMELSSPSSYQVIKLPEEERTGVMKIVNPSNWAVVSYDLSAFKGKNITLRFSVNVKRIGTAGDLKWQVNNEDYPLVGKQIDNAAADTWHTMSGEWTGTPNADFPSLFLGTHESNSENTTYYIDNFTITIL